MIKFKRKRKGYILLEAVLAMIVTSMISLALFQIVSGQFAMIGASKTALHAQQYAEIDANTLQLIPYDDLDKGAHERKAITSIADAAGWEDEIKIGEELVLDEENNTKQRIATVKIYKEGDTLSRYSLQVPLSSQGNGSVPKGTILPYYGDLASIPTGFKLCDGSNGTPDLRGRTLVGTGSWSDTYGSITYSLGNTGGERLHRLTILEIPSHTHEFPGDDQLADAFGISRNSSLYNWDWTSERAGVNPNGWYNTRAAGGNQPHNIMMPYMAIHWIMKI